jgi:hypothetical protein
MEHAYLLPSNLMIIQHRIFYINLTVLHWQTMTFVTEEETKKLHFLREELR